MSPAADLFDELLDRHGLALDFDSQGRCVIEHEDDFRILLALRDDSHAIAFAVVVSYVMSHSPAELYAELLKENLTGRLPGRFYFALDAAAGRILLTCQERVADLTSDSFLRLVDLMVATRRRIAGIVDGAQAAGITFDEALAESDPGDRHAPADDAATPQPPGQLV